MQRKSLRINRVVEVQRGLIEIYFDDMAQTDPWHERYIERLWIGANTAVDGNVLQRSGYRLAAIMRAAGIEQITDTDQLVGATLDAIIHGRLIAEYVPRPRPMKSRFKESAQEFVWIMTEPHFGFVDMGLCALAAAIFSASIVYLLLTFR